MNCKQDYYAVRLRHITEITEERKKICDRYLQKIQNPLLELPKSKEKRNDGMASVCYSL